LSLVLQHLGSYEEAEPLLEEALEVNRRLGQVEAQVVNLGNLGTLALETGDFSRSMDFFQQAERLADSAPDEAWAEPQMATSRLNQAVVLEAVGAYRESLEKLEEVSASGALPKDFETSYKTTLGVVFRNLGDPYRALRAFEEALEAFRIRGDLAGQANAWLNVGIARELNLRLLEEAEVAYRSSLAFARQSKERAAETLALYYLGRVDLEQGQVETARGLFRQTLHLAQESGISEGEWAAYEGLGRCSVLEGDLDQAAQLQERAIELLEMQRSRLHRPELRAGYLGDRRSPYAVAVQVYAQLEARTPGSGAAERALELVQRAKSRELLESLGSARSGARPLTATEIVETVGGGRLLELFVAEEQLFAWWVHAGRIELLDLGPSEPIIAAAVEVHRSLASEEDPPEERLRYLSTSLLASLPSEGWKGSKLWLAPDRELHYLPFELLPLPEAVRAAPRRLIEETAIAYLPSASSLAWLEERQPTGSRVYFTGFALPAGRPGPPPQGLSASVLLRSTDLGPLPASQRELETSARQIGGPARLRVGAEATETALREDATAGCRILHLATHAVVREAEGSSAAVLLAPSPVDDGLLSPGEIASMEAKVDLTVLASCRTALGSGDGARALSSLSGSLLAAGSRAVVATLWDVGDEATAAFMEQFYYQLHKGLPPALALRKAKLRLLSEPGWSDPSLWAAYVLIGDPPAILPATGWRRWRTPSLVVLGLLLVFLLWIFRRSFRSQRLSTS
ncbi:MAG: CHAT domain-containing protein, partial [Acidobacteria bacterium]|nr:CHAT domain-containing protein [Acidobacteriota bacterium]